MQKLFAGLMCSRNLRKGLLAFALLQTVGQAMAGTITSVREQLIAKGKGLPVETLVMSPGEAQTETLPVLVMNHGFLLSQSNYREMLAEVVKEGFVVLAPQTHAAGGLPFGKPTTDKEAQITGEVIAWFRPRLGELVAQSVNFEQLGLINHSRGSKVAWTIQRDGLAKVRAIAAIDPVDGNKDGSPKVTGGSFKMTLPTLIIGTGLGGSCAPADSNYNQFWATLDSTPAWLFVAKDFGHLDVLDNSNCGLVCNVCTKASPSFPIKDLKGWVGRTIGHFMQGILNDDAAALDQVETAEPKLNLTLQKR